MAKDRNLNTQIPGEAPAAPLPADEGVVAEDDEVLEPLQEAEEGEQETVDFAQGKADPDAEAELAAAEEVEHLAESANDVADQPLDPKDELIQKLYADIAYRDALLKNANIEVKSAVARSEEGLPDSSEIDATKITSPVLTRQGYVLPAGVG